MVTVEALDQLWCLLSFCNGLMQAAVGSHSYRYNNRWSPCHDCSWPLVVFFNLLSYSPTPSFSLQMDLEEGTWGSAAAWPAGASTRSALAIACAWEHKARRGMAVMRRRAGKGICSLVRRVHCALLYCTTTVSTGCTAQHRPWTGLHYCPFPSHIHTSKTRGLGKMADASAAVLGPGTLGADVVYAV
jgi:hypothetical protein